MRMKILQSERLDRAREQMRQKARELKKRGQAVASAAAENPRLQRLKRAMQRKMDEEKLPKTQDQPTKRNCSTIVCIMIS